MRKILFRGKRVDNGEWETGSLVYARMGTSEEQASIADKMTAYHTPVIPESIGQYTGVRDRNGTRIFEGDIVKVADEYIDYAIWANGCFCMARQIMFYEFTYQDSNRMEVIGNIYDNPELLK